MFRKTTYALLLVLLSSFLPLSVMAEQTELTTDPFVQQSLNRANQEPDGKYFGFGGTRGDSIRLRRPGNTKIHRLCQKTWY